MRARLHAIERAETQDTLRQCRQCRRRTANSKDSYSREAHHQARRKVRSRMQLHLMCQLVPAQRWDFEIAPASECRRRRDSRQQANTELPAENATRERFAGPGLVQDVREARR